MSDLISRSELIEDIKRRKYIDKPLEEIFETIIDEQPTVEPVRGEWIPVSERLPKRGEQVMVCNRYGSVFVSAITYMNAKVFSTGECHDFGKHYGVVAWQPLPAPYDMRKKVRNEIHN